MNESQLNKRLREEVEQLAPNRLEELLAACDTPPAPRKDGRVISFGQKPKRSHWQRFVAVAAMLILIIGIGTFAGVREFSRSILTFDVNPSVSVMVNGFDRVCQVQINNEDAAVLLYDDDLKGMTLSDAVETLTEEFIQAGYITDASNGILVTVQDASDSRAAKLQQMVLSSVETAAENSSLHLAVLYQKVDDDQSTIGTLSAGKSALVQTLAKNSKDLDEAELKNLSIQDLFYVMDTLSVKPDSAKLTGVVSRANYQNSDVIAALAAQACPADVSKDSVTTVLDCFDRGLAYVANVVTDTAEYAYTVSATSGQILEAVVTPTTAPEETSEPTPTVTPTTPDPTTPVNPDPVPSGEPEPTPAAEPVPTPTPAEEIDDPLSPEDFYEKVKDFADALDRIF